MYFYGAISRHFLIKNQKFWLVFFLALRNHASDTLNIHILYMWWAPNGVRAIYRALKIEISLSDMGHIYYDMGGITTKYPSNAKQLNTPLYELFVLFCCLFHQIQFIYLLFKWLFSRILRMQIPGIIIEPQFVSLFVYINLLAHIFVIKADILKY